MSIFRGLTLVISNPTLLLLVWSFTSSESATSLLVAKTQKGYHHVIFHSPEYHVPALCALGCYRGADGATMLASPLTAARADTATNAAIQLAQASDPQNSAAAGATETKGETVEQRIKNLHAALKITPEQDSKWNEVAQDMRENAAAMDKLIAANRTTPPQGMTAVEDLKMYQKFAQAHVDGLKNLISSFDKLYAAMPDAQKKIADQVFSSSRT